MFYGNMTEELEELSEKYFEKFGYYPEGEISVSYGNANYDDYINDIKECIKTNVGIARLNKKRRGL